jgi:crotonobetainyl-CoA:carnitine CoA-transferase CaiB-like acyl-CoA transferase
MFDEYRVLELGTWVFVPAATTVLADFGADVVKIEHPVRGDPQRGLSTGGVTPNQGGVSIAMEQTNRGKRSVGLDVGTPEGRDILYELAARADVFVTSFLPAARRKMQVDVEHIRAHNPDIVYVRADAVGPEGPDAGKPGYDQAVFFGRGGILDSLNPGGGPLPPTLPGFGDKTGAMNIAFGVAAALLKRERTGEPSVVDVSLLASALWVNSSSVIYSAAIGADFTRQQRRNTNPVAGQYRTADGRWIGLTMLESDRWWPELCRHIDRADLLDDPRFADAAARSENSAACAEALAATFAAAPLAEWRRRLATLRAPWEVVQDQLEVLDDPQARANGYVTEVEHPTGRTITVVRAPVQFDGGPPTLGVAPEPGAHTEEVLLELGHDWDDIIRFKELGTIA